MNIQNQLNKIKASLPENVELVAVSKTHPDEIIMEAYRAGQRAFGENKVQELAGKYERLPKDIEWHMIGHLQSNKVKYIAHFVQLIHGVDSLKLLKVINKEGAKANRRIDCLLQVHIASEESKFGLSENELFEFLVNEALKNMNFVRIRGLMGMASNTADEAKVRSEFRLLKDLFDQIKSLYFAEDEWFNKLSMGMSGDYQLAVSEGSNMVRIGSRIFGHRAYPQTGS